MESLGTVKTVIWLVVGLLLSVFLTAVVLVATGRMAVVLKDADQQLVLHRDDVCGQEVIDTYNDASQDLENEAALAEVYEQVSVREDYREDPTCVYIALRHQIKTRNASESRELFERLVSLSEEGRRVSDKINRPMIRVDLQQSVEWLEEFDGVDTSEFGSG